MLGRAGVRWIQVLFVQMSSNIYVRNLWSGMLLKWMIALCEEVIADEDSDSQPGGGHQNTTTRKLCHLVSANVLNI